jgi:diguanylate cyclase (GGDEF)-like protein
MRTASRLREMIVQERIPHAASAVADHITISQGVVTVRPDGEFPPTELIKRADRALYSAKAAGRNAIAGE